MQVTLLGNSRDTYGQAFFEYANDNDTIPTIFILMHTGNAGKKGTASAKKSGVSTKPPPKKEEKKGPSPQDLAAIVIQKYVRRLEVREIMLGSINPVLVCINIEILLGQLLLSSTCGRPTSSEQCQFFGVHLSDSPSCTGNANLILTSQISRSNRIEKTEEAERRI